MLMNQRLLKLASIWYRAQHRREIAHGIDAKSIVPQQLLGNVPDHRPSCHGQPYGEPARLTPVLRTIDG